MLETISFLCFSISSNTDLSESECSEIRLDQNGGSMEMILVGKQHDDLCYTHTAVDLIHAKPGNQNQLSSPLDAAAHFKSTTPASFLQAFRHY